MSKTAARLLNSVVRAATAWQPRWKRAATLGRLSGCLIPQERMETARGAFTLRCPHPRALYYVRDFDKHEPETVAWLSSIKGPATLWDIGANIGVFTVFAALDPETTVYAFEPSAPNFAELCANIALNGQTARVHPFCLAFSDKVELTQLEMGDSAPGSAKNAIAGSGGGGGAKQAIPVFTLDRFAETFALNPPNYIKLDVDGVEEWILKGGPKLLAAPELKEALVEIDKDDGPLGDRIRALMTQAGFDGGQVLSDGYNVLFRRP